MKKFNVLLISSVIILMVLAVANVANAQVFEEWVARYNGTGNGWDISKTVAVDSDGNVYITGSSDNIEVEYDYVTIKYDSAGVEQWLTRFDGPGNGNDNAMALVIDADRNIYVTGYCDTDTSSASDYDYTTVKYNSEGVEQWVATYTGPNIEYKTDVVRSIAVDADGNVYVTGNSPGTGAGYAAFDYATVKYDANGVEQWVARYDGPANGWDVANMLVLDADRNVYVTGWSAGIGTGDLDYCTIKYNNDGVEQWVARYNGPGNGTDCAYSLVLDPNQNVYITGYSPGEGGDYDYATIKYNSAGVEQWVLRYDGPANGSDKANDIALDAEMNVYVIGGSAGIGTGSYDYATIKYDSAGVEQWVARYNGEANGSDNGKYIEVDSDGNVYVTGYSSGLATSYDITTVKYDTDGAEQWVARYNGPAYDNDYPNCITLDLNANVYVTGYGPGVETGYCDFVTIKYSQTPPAPSPVTITLTPYGAPIQIPAVGGSFDYNIAVENTSASTQICDLWCDVLLPTGYTVGPVVGPFNLTIPVGFIGDRDRTQFVPERAPAGPYTYNGYVGVYPDSIIDQDSFTFEKLTTGDGVIVNGWENTGDSFDPWMTAQPEVVIPEAYSLKQNYPNPFNPTTTISFDLPENARVILAVYDVSGRIVAELVNGWRDAGTHEAVFDATNLASGVYIYSLTAGSFNATGKMVMMK